MPQEIGGPFEICSRLSDVFQHFLTNYHIRTFVRIVPRDKVRAEERGGWPTFPRQANRLGRKIYAHGRAKNSKDPRQPACTAACVDNHWSFDPKTVDSFQDLDAAGEPDAVGILELPPALIIEALLLGERRLRLCRAL